MVSGASAAAVRAELAAESLPSVRVSKTHREQQPLRKGAHFCAGIPQCGQHCKGSTSGCVRRCARAARTEAWRRAGGSINFGFTGACTWNKLWFTLIFFSHAFFCSCPLPVRSAWPAGAQGLHATATPRVAAAGGSALRPRQVEYAVEREGPRRWWHAAAGPRLAEGSAGNRLLHCDRQHAVARRAGGAL